MYELETSSGLTSKIANAEQISGAIAAELDRTGQLSLQWTVTTPHGTTITDTIAPPTGADIGDPLDRVYALLLRDSFDTASSVLF